MVHVRILEPSFAWRWILTNWRKWWSFPYVLQPWIWICFATAQTALIRFNSGLILKSRITWLRIVKRSVGNHFILSIDTIFWLKFTSVLLNLGGRSSWTWSKACIFSSVWSDLRSNIRWNLSLIDSYYILPCWIYSETTSDSWTFEGACWFLALKPVVIKLLSCTSWDSLGLLTRSNISSACHNAIFKLSCLRVSTTKVCFSSCFKRILIFREDAMRMAQNYRAYVYL